MARRRWMRSAVGGWVPKIEEAPAAARGLMIYMGATTRLAGMAWGSCVPEILRRAWARAAG